MMKISELTTQEQLDSIGFPSNIDRNSYGRIFHQDLFTIANLPASIIEYDIEIVNLHTSISVIIPTEWLAMTI